MWILFALSDILHRYHSESCNSWFHFTHCFLSTVSMQGETQTSAARQSQEPEESQPNQRQLQVESQFIWLY